MNQIQIANILLTRRCNLSCSYCNIVSNYKTKPREYPAMGYYAKHELGVVEWMRMFNVLKKNNPNIFFILYGGEPFMYEDLGSLLRAMHQEDMNYTVITNNTDFVQPKLLEIAEQLGGYKGLTSSVDPLILNPEISDSDRAQKSRDGLERLSLMKRNGIASDVVAEITCDSENISYLYKTVELLTQRSIWSSITVIDKQKSSFYDFSSVEGAELLLTDEPEVWDEFNKIIKDETPLLVHIPDLLVNLFNDLPCNMHCKIFKDIHNITIEPDGSVRLCLRIRGTETPSKSWIQLINSKGQILPKFWESLEVDYEKYCLGCNWTCMYMSKYYSPSVVDHGEEGEIEKARRLV